ncbi:MAG: hypothetical protein WDN66_02585 [Candidatus Saccharibacteria bacterium]
MSLTSADLLEIRKIVKEEVTPIYDELEAIRSDIEEIYDRITAIEHKIIPSKQFEKLTLEQKILKLNSELLVAARQAGITLPR